MRGAIPGLVLVLALAGCQRSSPPPAATGNAGKTPQVHDWPLPVVAGSAQPDLVATDDGRLLLTWISNVPGRRNALQFIAYGSDDRWLSAPRTVVVGDALLADSANTPHMQATGDGALWVQWLQRAGTGAVAMLSRSVDGGFNWSAPAQLNSETGADNGFVALWPAATDRVGVAWLDAGAADDGTMELHAAQFDRVFGRSAEATVDTRVCECCQTAVAATANGPLLLYRDRSGDEIRDIFASRFDGRAWSTPKSVHADHWKMPACPVNGPAVAARGNDAVVAWYTAADGVPTVKLARSGDGGDSFAAPVVVDRDASVQGRVAVALDAREAWVLWLREDARGQSLQLARFAPDLARPLGRIEVARLQGRGRGTGFPQLAVREDGAWIVWTDIVDGSPLLRGAHYGR